jgi:hypothetical protein
MCTLTCLQYCPQKPLLKFMLKLTNWRTLFCNRLWWFFTLWESPREVSIYDHIFGGVSGPCPYRSYQKIHYSVSDFDWKIKTKYIGLIMSALHTVNQTCTANRILYIQFPAWVTNFHWICINTGTKAQNTSPTVINLRNLLQCCHCFLPTEFKMSITSATNSLCIYQICPLQISLYFCWRPADAPPS